MALLLSNFYCFFFPCWLLMDACWCDEDVDTNPGLIVVLWWGVVCVCAVACGQQVASKFSRRPALRQSRHHPIGARPTRRHIRHRKRRPLRVGSYFTAPRSRRPCPPLPRTRASTRRHVWIRSSQPHPKQNRSSFHALKNKFLFLTLKRIMCRHARFSRARYH